MLCRRWRRALRSRPAGGGFKPPQAALVKSQCGERCGKGGEKPRQVRTRKASISEPLMTRRNHLTDVETELVGVVRDKPGGYLLTDQAASGVEVARAWSTASARNV